MSMAATLFGDKPKVTCQVTKGFTFRSFWEKWGMAFLLTPSQIASW